jgi:hypothetical protein
MYFCFCNVRVTAKCRRCVFHNTGEINNRMNFKSQIIDECGSGEGGMYHAFSVQGVHHIWRVKHTIGNVCIRCKGRGTLALPRPHPGSSGERQVDWPYHQEKKHFINSPRTTGKCRLYDTCTMQLFKTHTYII